MFRTLRTPIALLLVALIAVPAPVLARVTADNPAGAAASPAAPDAPATPAATSRCKARSVVVVAVGSLTREAAEFEQMLSDALLRYPCYKVRDVVDTLEAGLGEGLARIEEGRREAEIGQQESLEVRLESARGHLHQAADAFSAGFAYLPYAGPLVDVLMQLGVAEAATGESDRAVDAFRQALRLRPDADIADWSAIPEAATAFQAARRLATSGKTGALVVDSTPAPAEVWIDGRFAGVTPLDEPALAAGPHWVVLRKPGWARKSVRIDVPAGASATLPAEQTQLVPARRRPLYEKMSAKLAKAGPDEESPEAIEDLKALFLSDMAMVLRIRQAGDGFAAHVALWDLSTMERIWTGVEPETGTASELGRGGAESLISRAVGGDEERGRVEESGAATVATKEGGIETKWWFWTIIGVAVVGGTTAALLLTRPKGEDRGLPHDGTGGVLIRF